MQKRKHLTTGNIIYLVVVSAVAISLLSVFSPLIYPIRILWAKTLTTVLSGAGLDVSRQSVDITVLSISNQYPFSFASPHTGMFLYLETLIGLMLIGLFFVTSRLLKWAILVLSLPISTFVATVAMGLTIISGVLFSPQLGLFLYFKCLGFLTHIILLLLIICAIILKTRMRSSVPNNQIGNIHVRENKMKRPLINSVVKLWFLIICFVWIFICLWCIRDAYFPTQEILQKHPLSTDNFYLFNKLLALVSPFIGALHLWLVKKLNRPRGSKRLWFVIMLILLASTLLLRSPIAFVVLIFWCSKNNRVHHFEQADRASLDKA